MEIDLKKSTACSIACALHKKFMIRLNEEVPAIQAAFGFDFIKANKVAQDRVLREFRRENPTIFLDVREYYEWELLTFWGKMLWFLSIGLFSNKLERVEKISTVFASLGRPIPSWVSVNPKETVLVNLIVDFDQQK